MSVEVIVAAALVANTVVISELLRWRRAVALQRTLQAALAAGALDVVDKLLASQRETHSATIAIGVILVAAGLAIAGFGMVSGGEGAWREAVAASLFPRLIGAAVAGTAWMQRRGERR